MFSKVLLYFHTGFISRNYKGHGACFSIFYIDFFIFLFKQVVVVCLLYVDKWVTSTLFGWLVRRNPVPKHDFLSCLLKLHRVFFLMVWHVAVYGGWSWWLFFLSFFSFSCLMHHCLFCFCFFSFNLYYFDLLFYSYSFYKGFVCF